MPWTPESRIQWSTQYLRYVVLVSTSNLAVSPLTKSLQLCFQNIFRILLPFTISSNTHREATITSDLDLCG